MQPGPPPQATTDRAIAGLAQRQHGFVTADQLHVLGLSHRAIGHRCAAGRLHRVHRGVYAVGHRPTGERAAFHAAVLAVGPDAVLSHESAAALWGLLAAGRLVEVHVTTTRCLHARPLIRVHRTRSLPPADTTRRLAIPVTTVTRTLGDLAATVPPSWLRRALREAEVQRLVEPAELPALARPRRRGAPALRALTQAGPAPTRSELEDRVLALIRQQDLPQPLVNARVSVGGRDYEVDFLFPGARLIVEADGARYHDSSLARESDAIRQAALEAAGYRVLRVTWRQVTEDAGETATRIRQALRAAAPA